MFKLTITLQDGKAHTFTVERMPQNWKSWLMHQLPYGTVMTGCTFKREQV